MKRTIMASAALLVAVTMAAPAEARRSRPADEHSVSRHSSEPRNFWDGPAEPARRAQPARANREDYSSSSEGSHSVGARPGKWCGWYLRTQKGGGPELKLAANRARWGSAASGPHVGAVVVWPHHVGEITGQASNGQWVVRSGNDGGRVRERAQSVAGARFRTG